MTDAPTAPTAVEVAGKQSRASSFGPCQMCLGTGKLRSYRMTSRPLRCIFCDGTGLAVASVLRGDAK